MNVSTRPKLDIPKSHVRTGTDTRQRERTSIDSMPSATSPYMHDRMRLGVEVLFAK
jgi:hypothetical protein